MSHQSDLIANDIDAYLAQHERKELLRFLTCGSVDDGKSTLIGRLLYDSKMIYEDQLAAVQRDSAVHGTTGGDFDPALLTDGLKAEREQGITIDVAYRYFSTARRKFIIADTPGHEQYTRNMATGASTCDLAIILIDARNGVVEQTKRHSFITSLLGIKHVLVAINKMDLVDYNQEAFEQIKSDYTKFAARMSVDDVHFIPISALVGDNVVDPGENMPWYDGGTLMHMLETVHIASDRNFIDFRFPVQFVNRPNLDFRGFCGTIASGIVRQGDEVVALPSGKTSTVKEIVTYEGTVEEAFAPMSVTLRLQDEIDVSRGDMLVHPGNMPRTDQKFDAMIVWMSEDPLVPGKQYAIKHTSKEISGTVDTLRYRVDVNTLRRQDSPTLKLNEIGRCHLTLNQAIMYDGYRRNRSSGAFILMDRLSNATVAAGMILDRVTTDEKAGYWDDEASSEHLRSSTGDVTQEERIARFGQRPVTILITGLTGSGKTTIAHALERRLFDQGRCSTVIDGQNLRIGLNKDLGFSTKDRSENLRRTVEVAKLFNGAGIISICAFVAPNREIRNRFRDAFTKEQFIMVHLAAPVEVCRERDEEGMYVKAEAGEIENFPGVSADYEPPRNCDLTLPTDQLSVERCVDELISLLESRGIVI
ncbi:MAG: bifunctional sulfate adenylyltransferase subunit 1/adenylylsulfate kinase [Planctomycetaceae bacterium]|nr:bifunctional sulfate adenylyltransferase subunit 1/adenylylsulfate kinase [Planctomycetaceae bacterium]